MKESRFTEARIMSVLKQAEAGMSVVELCRQYAISNDAFYKRRAKYGGVDASMIAGTKAIQEENRRLKQMFAELSMQNEPLKEAPGKNSKTIRSPKDGRKSSGTEKSKRRTGVPNLWFKQDVLSLQP